jgi:hypothetical protein
MTKRKYVLEKGEIGGFMCWADLESRSTEPERLLCVSDTLDELINSGWKVVEETEKRVREDTDSGSEIQDEEVERPVTKVAKK